MRFHICAETSAAYNQIIQMLRNQSPVWNPHGNLCIRIVYAVREMIKAVHGRRNDYNVLVFTSVNQVVHRNLIKAMNPAGMTDADYTGDIHKSRVFKSRKVLSEELDNRGNFALNSKFNVGQVFHLHGITIAQPVVDPALIVAVAGNWNHGKAAYTSDFT